MNSTVPTADVTELKVTLARVDERMAALQRDAEARDRVQDARHAENRATMLLYVPRPEVEAMHKAMSDRVTSLEGFRTLVFRCVLPIGGLVIGGLVALGKLAPGAVNLP